MLAPDALSQLLGVHVHSVTQQPYEVAHRSANELQQVWIETDAGRSRLILKQFQPTRDWVMRLTHDTLTREAMLFVHGIYVRMPGEIVVPVIAAARTGTTWATLMYDVSPELLPLNQMLESDAARVLIQHLAALHAHFSNDPALENPALGLSSLQDFLTILSPRRVQDELDAGRTHPVLEMAARGWEHFDAAAPEDVRCIIHDLQNEPAPLLQVLKTLPQTLVHADYKIPNLGVALPSPTSSSPREIPPALQRRNELTSHRPPRIDDGARTIVLDWQDATRGAGVMDLGYFLALNARWLPFGHAEAIEIYTTALTARGHTVSPREIQIGLLAGGALRLLWLMVLNQQNDLNWWYDLCRATISG